MQGLTAEGQQGGNSSRCETRAPGRLIPEPRHAQNTLHADSHQTRSRQREKRARGPAVPGLGQRREGRQLVYDLSARHRGSLLLNYAMQKILRAGHEEEVAEVGPSLASYFGVIHRLMATRLREAVGADAPRLRRIAQDLKVGPRILPVSGAVLGCSDQWAGSHAGRGRLPQRCAGFVRPGLESLRLVSRLGTAGAQERRLERRIPAASWTRPAIR